MAETLVANGDEDAQNQRMIAAGVAAAEQWANIPAQVSKETSPDTAIDLRMNPAETSLRSLGDFVNNRRVASAHYSGRVTLPPTMPQPEYPGPENYLG